MSCICPNAGWCERHQVEKHQRWWELCKAGPHFELWEQGRGPGQAGTDPKIDFALKSKLEKGRAAWAALHSYKQAGEWDAQRAKRWYSEWKLIIPKYGCNCLKHWKELEEQYPPVFESEQTFWMWGWERHNDVNRRLGAPEMSLAEAVSLWRSD